MTTYTAFRSLHSDKIHTILVKELIKRAEVVKRILSSGDKRNCDLPANIFYTYINNRLLRTQRRNKFTVTDMELEAEKFLDVYYEDI